MAGEAMTAPSIDITVVYSSGPRCVNELLLYGPPGCSASHALAMVAPQWGIALDLLPVLQLGVWGKPVDATHPLQEGERLEIYRPLTVDPKVARRERFVRQGAKGAGLFANRRAGAKAGY